MAKVSSRGGYKSGRHRRVNLRALMKRSPDGGFEACVALGRSLLGASVKSMSCATGANPRRALADALEGAAHKLYARGGAFEGMKRKRRRR